MSALLLADQAHRDQALDISRSFTVQAPAGSGKTELLSLRYLKLLSVSRQPEEVLAITFTKKAASEMRDRIVNALNWAAAIESGKIQVALSDLEVKRLRIVRDVLNQNKKCGWQLLENPTRLRVQTIDSFCFYLANQLPVISRLGGGAQISEDVEPVFIDAVRTTLAELESNTPAADDIGLLLQHLDNDISKVERLLSSLLHKRDQWLPHVLGIRSEALIDKSYLRESLNELISESLELAAAELLRHERELVELINFAASNYSPQNKRYIPDYYPLSALPDTTSEALPYWALLVNMALTNAGDWRKRIDTTIGFPSGDKKDKAYDALCKSKKEQFKDFLDAVSDNDTLRESLGYIGKLPDLLIEETQWTFLLAIARTLVLLNAKLLLSFRKFRTVDYTQISAAARDALYNDSMPSDLALALDRKIQHILVDEFQDTSKLQIDIVRQLIAGWQHNDGRTLFVVGDAMQSCYGFRNAKVGLFIHVRNHGLGDLELVPLTLQTNFRSQANIVSWVNQVFHTAFPATTNSSRGAVPYTASVPFKDAQADAGISTNIITYEQGQRRLAMQREATMIVDRIACIRKTDPLGSIAILVRNRTHLGVITTALREANIHWLSTDIDRLESLPIIKDLSNLCRALLNLADRVAWLALLRAPWCGLTIADLFAVQSHAGEYSIYSALMDVQNMAGLSEDGVGRLQDIVSVLNFALNLRYRCDFHRLIETIWLLLRGPAMITTEIERESVTRFFQLLANEQAAGGIANVTEFEARLNQAYVPSKTDRESANTVQLMTMHKAKGLEYDHVILPGLGHGQKNQTKPLLQWHERQNEQGEFRLFIATLSATGSDDDALYNLLRYEQRQKELLESTRLLYIAVTRAKKSAWLFATLPLNSKGETKPPDNSLLQRIWPELQRIDAGAIRLAQLETPQDSNAEQATTSITDFPIITPIRRVRAPVRLSQQELTAINGHTAKAKAAAVEVTTPPDQETREIDDRSARVGTLIHRALETYITAGAAFLSDENLTNLRRYWRRELRSLIDSDDDQNSALDFIENSVKKSVSDDKIRWIFDPQLEQGSTELSVTSSLDGYPVTYVIDRSFIDTQDRRWIIDYKTAACPADKNVDQFEEEQITLHRKQLENYRRLFYDIESRQVKIALLFTSIQQLVVLEPR